MRAEVAQLVEHHLGAREAFHLVDALVTMTVDDGENCRIEVQEITESAAEQSKKS